MSLTAAQLERRREGIGASEIAAVAGVSRYRTPFDVWLAKVEPDIVVDTSGSAAQRGSALERMTGQLYAERERLTVFSADTREHPKHPWALATPDLVVPFADQWIFDDTGDYLLDKGLVERLAECKWVESPRAALDWGLEGTDEIPQDYYCQTQWQMHVCGVKRCDVAVQFAGREGVFVYPIEYAPDVAYWLFERAREFWFRYVVTEEAPPLDDGNGALRYLEAKFPRNNGAMLAAPLDAEELGQKLALIRARMSADEIERDALEVALKARIGAADGIDAATWRATWRLSKSSGVDWKSIAQVRGATPDDIAAHTRPGVRKFLFTEKETE